MRKTLLALPLVLAGCVTAYTPSVDQTGVDQAKYAADAQACHDEAVAKKDASAWSGIGQSFIPIIGMAESFNSDNAWTFPGFRKNVNTCLSARGYRIE